MEFFTFSSKDLVLPGTTAILDTAKYKSGQKQSCLGSLP